MLTNYVRLNDSLLYVNKVNHDLKYYSWYSLHLSSSRSWEINSPGSLVTQSVCRAACPQLSCFLEGLDALLKPKPNLGKAH